MSRCYCTGACKLTGRCPNTVDMWRDLAAKQEPLGGEFQKLTDDNFWYLVTGEEVDGDDTEEHY